MFPRIIQTELKLLARQFRSVTLLGPRQAGKSTLAQLTFPDYEYVSLEAPDLREFARVDPRGFLNTYRSRVIIDEVQREPDLLSYLQGTLDKDDKKGQFVLTGSHQLALSEAVSQSLAGRTAILTLLPLSLEELDVADKTLEMQIWEGFMPGRAKDRIDVVRFYRSYFQTYVERDVRQMIQIRNFSQFETFVRLCAGRIGQVLNVASLANDIGVSSPTVQHWISILEASFIIFRLQPYFENFGKRQIKSPKLYFVDTGLACWLLGIENPRQLERDPAKGSLFENLVICEVLKAQLNRGRDPGMFYFRDSHGNELDLLLKRGRQLCPVEIKAGQTWNSSFTKGLKYFSNLAGEQSVRGLVCYGGNEGRVTDDYELIPLHKIAGLGAEEAVSQDYS
jgi:hypothetical protein